MTFFKKPLTSLLLFTLFFPMTVWAKIEKKNLAGVENFNRDYLYSVTLKKSSKKKLKDIPSENIRKTPQGLEIQTSPGQIQSYSYDEIKRIEGASRQKHGNYLGKGTLYGGLGGLGLGLAVGIPMIVGASKEITEDGLSSSAVALFGSAAIAIPTVLGAGIGALVGAKTPKRDKIMITPSVLPSQDKISGKKKLDPSLRMTLNF